MISLVCFGSYLCSTLSLEVVTTKVQIPFLTGASTGCCKPRSPLRRCNHTPCVPVWASESLDLISISGAAQLPSRARRRCLIDQRSRDARGIFGSRLRVLGLEGRVPVDN